MHDTCLPAGGTGRLWGPTTVRESKIKADKAEGLPLPPLQCYPRPPTPSFSSALDPQLFREATAK